MVSRFAVRVLALAVVHSAVWLAPALAAEVAAKVAPKPVLPPAPEGVLIQPDLPYLEPGREERLDLYMPAQRPAGSRAPAIVFIHGGGWAGGDKAEARAFNVCTTLAKAGYVGVSINYMMAPGKRWPTNLHDSKNAVRWLRVNADRYGVDADHIGVIGGSAGGHLALLVAYTAGHPQLEPLGPYPGVPSTVQCVVNLYGITNLLTRQRTDAQGQPTGRTFMTQGLLTADRDADPEAWKLASPVTHVTAASPPTLILHGLADTTVDHEQAKELAARLTACQVEHTLTLIEGIGHTFDLQRWGKRPLPVDLGPAVVGFCDRHLKPLPAPGPR